LEKCKPDLLPVCADCRSTSLEKQSQSAHRTSVGNPVVARKPSLKRLRYFCSDNIGDIIKLSR